MKISVALIDDLDIDELNHYFGVIKCYDTTGCMKYPENKNVAFIISIQNCLFKFVFEIQKSDMLLCMLCSLVPRTYIKLD